MDAELEQKPILNASNYIANKHQKNKFSLE
jgi:hypothetical protein